MPVDHIVNEIVSLTEIMRLEVDKNDVEEFVEEHSQELTTEDLTELHCVSQKKPNWSLSGMEKVRVEPIRSGETKEMLKSWETVALYIGNRDSAPSRPGK
jgi:hypothetical protein